MGARHRVVLVDDNEVTRAALRLSLPGNLVEVVGEASSGQSGLELCHRVKPDIVLLDVMMPDMSGLELLPLIREELTGTEVVMVTAANDRTTIERAISLGACGYVMKPFTQGRVQDAIVRAISKISKVKN